MRAKLSMKCALAAAIVLAAAMVLATAAAPASAQEPTASELVDEGVRLREERRDADALERFERAYELEPAPRTLAQIALAEQALGRFVDAEAHLREALSSDDAFIRRHRALLETTLEEIGASLADLHIDGGAPGAAVIVAGREVGALPLADPVRVAIGSVAVEVRARGYEPYRHELQIAAGESPELTIELTPLPSEPQVRSDPEPARARPAGLSLGDVLTISGAASAGLGLASLVIASALMAVREDNAQARAMCLDTIDPACRDHYFAAVDAEAASIALYVAGGLLAAGGGVLLALGLLGERERAQSEAWSCTPSLLGVTCGGRF